jgi:hypothetical protein
MPVAELDISSYAGIPVKQKHIDFLFKQLDAYKKKAVLHLEFEPYVHEIAREIELMQKELADSIKAEKEFRQQYGNLVEQNKVIFNEKKRAAKNAD